MSWFGVDKIVGSVAEVAKEWIETDKESAEAKALFVKTLDPNGIMRLDISKKVSTAYMIYLALMALIILATLFGVGDPKEVTLARDSLTELFLPITGMFTTILGASFGVNWQNVKQGN